MKIRSVNISYEHNGQEFNNVSLSFDKFIAHVSSAITASGGWEFSKAEDLTEHFTLEEKYK